MGNEVSRGFSKEGGFSESDKEKMKRTTRKIVKTMRDEEGTEETPEEFNLDVDTVEPTSVEDNNLKESILEAAVKIADKSKDFKYKIEDTEVEQWRQES